MTTIKLSSNGMKISMPARERQVLLDHATNLLSQAVSFTERCCEILVTQYGATREWIEPGHIYYSHIGNLIDHDISGRKIKTAEEMVAEKIEGIRPEYLGLREHGLYAEAIKRQQEEYKSDIQGRTWTPQT